jgi:hypothetical protein
MDYSKIEKESSSLTRKNSRVEITGSKIVKTSLGKKLSKLKKKSEPRTQNFIGEAKSTPINESSPGKKKFSRHQRKKMLTTV